MKHEFSLQSERLLVSPLTENDIEALRLLRNANRFMFIYKDEISSAAQKAWFSQYLQKPGDYMFRAALRGDPSQTFIGASALYGVDEKELTTEFGRIVVDKKNAPKGLGTELTAATCRIGFEKLRLRRIILDVLESNPIAIHVYEKVGFRKYDCHDGLLFMELLAP